MYIKKWMGRICNDKEFFVTALKMSDHTLWFEWVHQNEGSWHCEACLKLNGCWFCADKIPKPHSFACHCKLDEIPYSAVLANATAVADYRKFDPYLFNADGIRAHGKEKLLKEWGYTVEDSGWLYQEFIRQGLEKYLKGEYNLGLLNEHGQRISITVEIPRRDKPQTATFISGWMVYPNGKIQLVTPYGGKIKNEIFR